MAKDPAFLFYPGDYLQDTQGMTERSQVAYDRIICKHMLNIPITQEQVNHFTKRLDDVEKSEVFSVLKKVDGGYIIEWVADSINKRKAYSESRRKNKKGKKQKHMLSHDTHMENENEIVNDIIILKGGTGGNFKEQLLESQIVIETVCRQNTISVDKANYLRELFILQMEATNEHHNNYQDYSSHFINWAKHNKKLLDKPKPDSKIGAAHSNIQEALEIINRNKQP